MEKIQIEALIATLGLTMEAKFIPFSESRNKGEKSPSLNWIVSIWKRSPNNVLYEVIETDYMQGCGHCASYKASVKALGERNSIMRDKAVRKECETGEAFKKYDGDRFHDGAYTISPPTIADVLYSLIQDASAIDYATYEQWAGDMGYDADSRKGEAIYRACLQTGLALRAVIREKGLAELKEAYTDF